MFAIAILIGIYSYLLFTIGLLGFFYKEIILFVSLLFFSVVLFFMRKRLSSFLSTELPKFIEQRSKLELFLVILLFLQGYVNFLGALGPELAFDALWYHLTLPKIYLMEHEIIHIPGSLLYYSDMPKLIELLYTAGLSLGSEVFAKLIHFSFGILCLLALYHLARKFFSPLLSLIVLVIFYSNLVVGWMSTSAYIDLGRTFFEIMALWGFVNWWQRKDSKWLIESAVMLGLAISAKLLALGSLFIFSILIAYRLLSQIKPTRDLFICLFVYLFIALLIPLPWFVFSLIHTGNPVYPFFTSIYPVKFNFHLTNPLNLPDPISPLYVIFLPIAAFLYRKLNPGLKTLSLYSFLAILVWYITPQTGGGRFILPYLPAFSILTIGVIREIKAIKTQGLVVGVIILMSLFSIIYRFGANLKYIPVILGKESKHQFLSSHLNFSFGDFYDTDSYFKNHIKADDKVLLYGFHNLYYVNFSFIDSSYAKKGDRFNYIAVKGNGLPERFKMWNLIYYNDKTNVRLYSIGHSTLRDESSGSDSKRGMKWTY